MRKWGLIDTAGQFVLPPKYDNLSLRKNKIVSICQNGLWGALALETQTILCPPKFKELDDFSAGVTGAFRDDGKWILVRPDGGQVSDRTFDFLDHFQCGLARAKSARLYGYIDVQGEWRIHPAFPIAEMFSENRAIVRGPEMLAYYINEHGERVTDPRYKAALSFSEGLAFTSDPNWTGYIDLEGKSALDGTGRFVHGGWFSDGICPVMVSSRPEKHIYVNRDGSQAFPGTFQDTRQHFEGLAAVKRKGQWGAIDRRGETVIPVKYDSVGNCRSGLIRARSGERYGYLNKRGEVAIPFQFMAARDFANGLAAVATNGD